MSQRYVSFRLGGGLYALAAAQVERIFAPGEPVPLPGAPPAVRGLAPDEGRLVALIELAPLLGLPIPPGPRSAMALTIPHRGLALLVPPPAEVEEGEPLRGAGEASVLLGGGPAQLLTAEELTGLLTRAVVTGRAPGPDEVPPPAGTG